MKKVILGFIGIILGILITLTNFAYLPNKIFYFFRRPFSPIIAILGALVIIASVFSIIPYYEKKKTT